MLTEGRSSAACSPAATTPTRAPTWPPPSAWWPVLLAFAALLAIALFALDPPSDRIGWPGWVIGLLLVLAGLGVAMRLNRIGRLWSTDTLLVVGYVGVAGIATLEWLSGSGTAAYDVLFIAWLGAGVVHPPRRSFAFLATL